MNESQKKLLSMMVDDVGAEPSWRFTKFPNEELVKQEFDAIQIVSNYLGVPLEKIYHPKGQNLFTNPLHKDAFIDCLPIDSWGNNVCVEIKSTQQGTLQSISKLGIPGLFVGARAIDWLNRSYIYCNVPRNFIAYHDINMQVAIVDYRAVLVNGVYGHIKIEDNVGFYLDVPYWKII